MSTTAEHNSYVALITELSDLSNWVIAAHSHATPGTVSEVKICYFKPDEH